VISKTALRARMRALRRRLAAEAPDAAVGAAACLPDNWPTAATVYALYHPVGSELDPGHIRLPALRRALPVVIRRDGPLVFRLHEPGETLVPDLLGVPAPASAAPQVMPDIVFTPALAFDRRGGRLGQGGGYYDRTIAALRAVRPVLVIGLAYAAQELPEIPMDEHDQRLDAILTETGFIPVARETR
jgi:5-formyltetrahydrofolate cyclo-ligase